MARGEARLYPQYNDTPQKTCGGRNLRNTDKSFRPRDGGWWQALTGGREHCTAPVRQDPHLQKRIPVPRHGGLGGQTMAKGCIRELWARASVFKMVDSSAH